MILGAGRSTQKGDDHSGHSDELVPETLDEGLTVHKRLTRVARMRTSQELPTAHERMRTDTASLYQSAAKLARRRMALTNRVSLGAGLFP